jgi:glycosyltransferase involved in cell wall biosynthesis
MFAPYCYPPAGSEAIVTSKLLLAMIDAGWEIDVISQSDFGHYYPASKNGIWDPIKKIVHNIPAFRDRSFFKKFSTLFYLQSISWARKAVRVARQLLSKRQYDFILSRATPQYGHLPALVISRQTGIPWIANWSDPLPPQKAPPPYGLGPTAHIPIYIKKYCEAIAGKATWHTFPCERLQKYISSYLKAIQNKSSVIPHIALERFLNSNQERKSGFSLCHIGSLTNRDPYIFLIGVKQFYKDTKISESFNIQFIGPESTRLQNVVESLKLGDIVNIENPKTYEETQVAQAKSTVLVLIEAACDEGIFFPSKFVDYIQTGRPILAVSPKVGTLPEILSSYGGGIAVNCNSSDDVAHAIKSFYSEWKTGTLDEKYSSFKLLHLFSEQTVLNMYMEIFAKITNKR